MQAAGTLRCTSVTGQGRSQPARQHVDAQQPLPAEAHEASENCSRLVGVRMSGVILAATRTHQATLIPKPRGVMGVRRVKDGGPTSRDHAPASRFYSESCERPKVRADCSHYRAPFEFGNAQSTRSLSSFAPGCLAPRAAVPTKALGICIVESLLWRWAILWSTDLEAPGVRCRHRRCAGVLTVSRILMHHTASKRSTRAC